MNSIFIVFLISLITTYKDVCFVQKAMQVISVQLWEWTQHFAREARAKEQTYTAESGSHITCTAQCDNLLTLKNHSTSLLDN